MALNASPAWTLQINGDDEKPMKPMKLTDMKLTHLNPRTAALLAAGALSMGAVARAEESASALTAALSSTTISGYVDTSAQWNFGTGNANNPAYSFGGSTKADGFNLNVVQLTIEKPLEDGEWAAGYRVDLWFGPDANALGSQAGGSVTSFPGRDLAVRQAYVALRTPVGNGIQWKIGVWDTIVGYEVLTSADNPNFTRSWGFTIEPTTHTGVHAGYQINGWLAAEACVVNTLGPTINGRAHPTVNGLPEGGPKAESFKAYMGSLALTAPENWGWAAGSTLKVAVINGFDAALGDNRTHWFAGGTLNTPVSGLKLGVAFDYADFHNQPSGVGDHQWVLGGYASYQATEKLSFHGRGEYYVADGGAASDTEIVETTFTVQYDLWKNVLSRVEFRWDHSANGDLFGGEVPGSPTRKNAFVLLANVVYRF